MKNLGTSMMRWLVICWNKVVSTLNRLFGTSFKEIGRDRSLFYYGIRVEHKIEEAIRDFYTANESPPTHVYMHPNMFKIMLIELRHYPPLGYGHMFSSSGNKFMFTIPGCTVEINFTAVEEKDDMLIAGNESAYSDFVMER